MSDPTPTISLDPFCSQIQIASLGCQHRAEEEDFLDRAVLWRHLCHCGSYHPWSCHPHCKMARRYIHLSSPSEEKSQADMSVSTRPGRKAQLPGAHGPFVRNSFPFLLPICPSCNRHSEASAGRLGSVPSSPHTTATPAHPSKAERSAEEVATHSGATRTTTPSP